MQISTTDARNIVKYLDDALKLYDALAAIPMQKAACRAHMIRSLTPKLQNPINHDKK